MEYNSANHTIYSCKYHIVFCPKYRRKILTDDIDTRLKELINELAEDENFDIVEMEVMPDHVHLLLDVYPGIAILDLVKHIKQYTASRLKKEFPALQTRLPNIWTRSSFIASVGAVSLETVKKYIEDQKRC